MNDIFGTPVMLALDATFVLYTLWALGLRRSGGRSAIVAAGVSIAWIATLHAVISTGTVVPSDIAALPFYSIILLGVAAVGALIFLVKPVRELLLGLDQQQLMLLQGIRVYFGAAFLIQGGLGLLPPAFGLIDGVSHISAGFLALLAAVAPSLRRLWVANAFGVADILVVATSLAFVLLESIGPHHPMMYAVFLPAPFWLWFHVVSIWKLLAQDRDAYGGEAIPRIS